MVNTQDFRTKSINIPVQNVMLDHYWPIALDIGYSSVKGFSPNMIYAFPAYAKNIGVNPTFYGDMEDDEILYKDNQTGEVWKVGKSAQHMVNERDTGDSQMELFGRDRYYSRMFSVLVRTGIAFGMMSNEISAYNGKPVYIQTGLPPAYLDEDKGDLMDVIAGHHDFSIRTKASGKYIRFDIDIEMDNISVISQPEGTLMSVAIDDEGNTIQEAKKYFQSNIIIFDAGFGTLDLFEIRDRTISSRETFSEYGMKKVLEKTENRIKKALGVSVRPSAMQNALETGKVTVKKRKGMEISSKLEPFDEYLEESSMEVCRDAVEKIMNIYSGLFNYQYLILTGGTSAAWSDYIKDYFRDVEGLTIIPGNANCPSLDMIFTNVRGYYMYAVNTLKRRR